MLDYNDLQAALKTSRGNRLRSVTLHDKLSRLAIRWRVAREELAKAEDACIKTAQFTPASPARQWAEAERVRISARMDDYRAELTAILHGAPTVKRAVTEPTERITQAAMF